MVIQHMAVGFSGHTSVNSKKESFVVPTRTPVTQEKGVVTYLLHSSIGLLLRFHDHKCSLVATAPERTETNNNYRFTTGLLVH